MAMDRALLTGTMVGSLLLGLALDAQAAEQAPARDRAKVSAESDDEHGGKFDSVRVGAGLGFAAPNGPSVALFGRSAHVGLGLRGSYLPLVALPGSDVELARWVVSGDLRLYPFGGAVFVGGAFGHARTRMTSAREVLVADVATSARGTYYTAGWFAGPEIGFQVPIALGKGGPLLTIGADVGLAIPIAPSDPRLTVSSRGLTVPVGADDPSVSALRTLAHAPIPWLNLIEVGVYL